MQAPTPVKAVAKGRATFATLAHVVVSKFDHHLPLYRQAEMMAARGVDLGRSTLAGWAGQAAALLDPIVSRIRDEGLKASKLHTDDTPVPVLDPGRGTTAQGRLWGLRGRRPRLRCREPAAGLVSVHARSQRHPSATRAGGVLWYPPG